MKKNFLSFSLILISFVFAAPAMAQQDQIADRLEIAEVVAKYSYALDYYDAEAAAALFTEDGLLEFYYRQEKEPFARFETRPAILEWARGRSPGEEGAKGGHHQSGLVFLELTETTAETKNMVIGTRQTASESAPVVSFAGTYFDSWVKTSDGWRIKHRYMRADTATPTN